MSNYDQWKLRAPEDDGPQEEFGPEEEQIDEAEYAIHDAENAFDALVEQWGEIATQKMLAIILRHGIRDLKQRRAAVLNSWRA